MRTWGSVLLSSMARGNDFGYAAFMADQWERRIKMVEKTNCYGWVIEYPSEKLGSLWVHIAEDGAGLTPMIEDAFRLARKEDAEAYISLYAKTGVATSYHAMIEAELEDERERFQGISWKEATS